MPPAAAHFISPSACISAPARHAPPSATSRFIGRLTNTTPRRAASASLGRGRLTCQAVLEKPPREPSPSDTIDVERVSAAKKLDKLYFDDAPSTSGRGQGADQPKKLSAKEKAKIRAENKAKARSTYLASAVAATFGLASLAVAATVYRFTRHLDSEASLPTIEIFATLLLIVGAAIGMEKWACWAHKELWHDWMWNIPEEHRYEWNKPIWGLHESHHEPRTAAFEANDIFAIINAAPAIALCAYGFLNDGIFPGCCFGAGLGITVFGISYMFVHDGLVHKRFPTGPIKDLPYLKRVALAHSVHHTERYDGVPWGLWLGPQELEEVGGGAYLDELVAKEDAREAELTKNKDMLSMDEF